MKSFSNKEEAKAYARTLHKQQKEVVIINGKQALVAGTPMIEDEVWSDFYEAAKRFTKNMGLIVPEDYLVDFASETRDNAMSMLGVDIIYGAEEF